MKVASKGFDLLLLQNKKSYTSYNSVNQMSTQGVPEESTGSCKVSNIMETLLHPLPPWCRFLIRISRPHGLSAQVVATCAVERRQ